MSVAVAVAAAVIAGPLVLGCASSTSTPVGTAQVPAQTINHGLMARSAPSQVPVPSSPSPATPAVPDPARHDPTASQAPTVVIDPSAQAAAEVASRWVAAMWSYDTAVGPQSWVEAVAPITTPALLAELSLPAGGTADWEERSARHEVAQAQVVAVYPLDALGTVFTVVVHVTITDDTGARVEVQTTDVALDISGPAPLVARAL
jgi:hypothetical protein